MAVIEITTFRLADDVDEAAFLEADERVRTGFLYRQPGLVQRHDIRAILHPGRLELHVDQPRDIDERPWW